MAVGDAFDITIDRSGATVTFTLCGEVDLSAVPRFDEALAGLEPDVVALVIDMAGVTFLDSSGIGCLIRARGGGSRPVTVRSPSVPVRKVLDLIDLGASIEIVD